MKLIKNIISLLIVAIFLFWTGYLYGQKNLDTRISDNSVMSTSEAELFIDSVIAPHQYYINHPEAQNYATGDTAHNQNIIIQYKRLKNLIEKIE